MRRLTSSWSNTLRKLGFQRARKSGNLKSRQPRFEALEERLNFSFMNSLGQTPTIVCPCGCACSPVKLSSNNGAITVAGWTTYSSSSDPVVSLQFQLHEETDELNNGQYVRADITVGTGSPISTYWAGGGGVSEPYVGEDDEYLGLFSIQVDASDLPTGVYNWNLTAQIYGDGDVPVEGTEYYKNEASYDYSPLHVVNRIGSSFGDGWSLPGLDQLIIQHDLSGRPDGVALLSSDDALIWFGEDYDNEANTYYIRERNPYNFSELLKDDYSNTYTLTDPDGTVHNFDGDGFLTSVVDRNGNTITSYHYESGLVDRITQLPDFDGPTTTFEYNEDDLIWKITDFCESDGTPQVGVSQTTEYTYSMTGSHVDQMQMTEPDPDGSSDPLQSPITTYNFDEAGRLTSLIDPRGLETDVEYDSVGLVHRIIERCGGTITIETLESQSAGSPTSSSPGMPLMIPYGSTDAITSATVESSGYEIQNIYGNTSEIVRGMFGNILAEKDAEGNVTRYTYDASTGLPYQVMEPHPDNPLTTLDTTYDFDFTRGLLTEIAHPSTTQAWGYDDDFAQVNSYFDGLHYTKYAIDDSNGNTLNMRQIIGDDDTLSEEDDDLVTIYTYTDGTYDAPLGLVETVTDPNDNVTHYTYNSHGLVTEIVHAENTVDVSIEYFEYDERDRLSDYTDGNGNTTHFVYDNLDRLIEEDKPALDEYTPGPVWHYFYDQNGNQTYVIDPLGNITQTVYDVRDRPFQVIQPVADPEATPYVYTFDDIDCDNLFDGNWDQVSRDDSYNDTVLVSEENGDKIRYQVGGLDDDKKYEVQVRWVPSETPDEYDSNALFEVYGDLGSDPLNKINVNLNSKPQGKPDNSNEMWLSLGAFSPHDQELYVILSDTDDNGKLVIDGVRFIEVGSVTQTEYDCKGNLVTTIDPLNNVTSYEYDKLNRLITRTDPDPDGDDELLSPITHYTYNAESWLTSVIDPEDDVTFYQYDDMGRQTNRIDVTGAGLRGVYRDGGEAIVHTRVDDNVDFSAATEFAGFNDLGDGFSVEWTGAIYLDDPGEITFYLDSTDASDLYIDGGEDPVVLNSVDSGWHGSQNDVALYAGWHTIKIRFQDVNYDSTNGIIASYDIGAGKVAIPMSALGTTQITKMTYDEAGNQLTLTDPAGNMTTWGYDDANRLSSETVTGIANPRAYLYDGGQLVQKTDRNGRVTRYEYDSLNRVKAEKWYEDQDAFENYPGSPLNTISYTYDAVGNLLSVDDPDANYGYEYDSQNRLTNVGQVITGLDTEISFVRAFDDDSRMTSTLAYIGNGNVAGYLNSYSYDSLGRVTSLTQEDTEEEADPVSPKRVEFTYNAASQLTALDRYASITTASPVASSTYTYDGLGRVKTIEHASTALDSQFAQTHSYEYDAASRVSHYASMLDENEVTYDYDRTSQITGANNSNESWYYIDETYAYDDNGNRTSLVNADIDFYGLESKLYSVGARNQYSSDTLTIYAYDDEGNLIEKADNWISYDHDIYHWDNRNRLVEVEHYAGNETAEIEDDSLTSDIQYRYDAFNRLIHREEVASGVTKDTTFIYENGQIVLQFDSVDVGATQPSDLWRRYLWAPAVDQLLADEQIHDVDHGSENDVLWALTDRQGSVTDMVDSNGAERLHRVFDSYGNVIAAAHYASDGEEVTSGAQCLDEAFGYTGRWYDGGTRLQNNLNRWYDPRLGRFLSEDPIGFVGDRSNLYRYVGNGPTNHQDPVGLIYHIDPFDPFWPGQDFTTMPGWTYGEESPEECAGRIWSPNPIDSGGFDQSYGLGIYFAPVDDQSEWQKLVERFKGINDRLKGTKASFGPNPSVLFPVIQGPQANFCDRSPLFDPNYDSTPPNLQKSWEKPFEKNINKFFFPPERPKR
jgi:RHS repeat-associated protein